MRELRAITDARCGRVRRAGYGEIATPALEYEEVLARADIGARAGVPGRSTTTANVLVLRSDMTVPIARVVATRYADVRAAAALLLRRARLPRRCARTAGSRASSCRPASSSSASRRRTAPPRR